VKSGKVERDKKPDLAFLSRAERVALLKERLARSEADVKAEIALLSDADDTERIAQRDAFSALAKNIALAKERIARLEANEAREEEQIWKVLEPTLRAFVANGWLIRVGDTFRRSEKFEQLLRRHGDDLSLDDLAAHDEKTSNPSLDQLEAEFRKSHRSDH
jgi:hypothetical protein